MKMYSFPQENGSFPLNEELTQEWISPALDAALIRLCIFMLAWAAGASMAVLLAAAG